MKEHHGEFASLRDLIKKWMIFGFGKRKQYNPEQPRDNIEMPESPR